jgi:hypothetical protein
MPVPTRKKCQAADSIDGLSRTASATYDPNADARKDRQKKARQSSSSQLRRVTPGRGKALMATRAAASWRSVSAAGCTSRRRVEAAVAGTGNRCQPSAVRRQPSSGPVAAGPKLSQSIARLKPTKATQASIRRRRQRGMLHCWSHDRCHAQPDSRCAVITVDGAASYDDSSGASRSHHVAWRHPPSGEVASSQRGVTTAHA